MFLKPNKKKQVDMPQCKYGLACSRKDCVFKHPARSKLQVQSDSESSMDDDICLPFLAGFCSFGESCYSKHPLEDECEALKKRFARKWCRFGSNCKTRGCLFRHTNPTADLVDDTTTPPKVAAPVIYATGPVYRDSSSSSLPNKLDRVSIPLGIFIPYDDSTASHAFGINDPIERFGYVNSQHSLRAEQPADCFVLDLHFQSSRTVGVVLNQILPQCIEYLESLGDKKHIWLVTGAGNHVPDRSHQLKGGVLYEAVLTAALAKLADKDFAVSEGLDPKGSKGAVRIKKK